VIRSALALGLVLAACRAGEATGPAPWSDAWLAREADRYLGATANRRAALEASLVNPENVYSRQRLASYGKDTVGWDALPVWNPRSVPVDRAVAEQLARGAWPELPADKLWDGVRPTTREAWVALGRRVFFEFPLRSEIAMEHALVAASPDAPLGPDAADTAAALGVARTADGAVPGVVVFGDVDGSRRVGITCAICHTAPKDGGVIAGAARRALDLGTLRLRYYEASGEPLDPGLARRMATWGPGRADVTEDDDEDPVAIPDLWGLRDERFLTQAGTIRQVGPAALAIRQETQLLHANQLRVRPPRELAWALAMYLYSLEPPPARPVADAAAVERGRTLFDAHCRLCHASAILGGDPMPVDQVGTEPSLANGKARGTGRYRVAPLVRIADGAPYLHDGSVPSLEALLSSERLAPDYAGGARGPGPIRGHLYGIDLPAADRAALIAYLAAL
jgi:cytochrome c5